MDTSAEPAGPAKILVAYYSLSGNTARVARDLARRLNADLESIEDKQHGIGFLAYLQAAVDALRGAPARIGNLTKNPADYALTIIGTPVWVGRMSPAVRGYLQKMHPQLRNVAFFVTSGGTAAGKIVPSLEELARQRAVASTGFDARELQDAAVYNSKIATFINDLGQSWRPSSGQPLSEPICA